MHPEAAKQLVESVRRRERQGDHPTEPTLSVETLEDCLLTVAQDRDVARQQLSEAQADRERLDWIESVYVGGDELFLDRCELEPEGGGALFIGFTIHRGQKNEGGSFVAGEESLRGAIDAARSPTPTSVPASSRRGDEPASMACGRCEWASPGNECANCPERIFHHASTTPPAPETRDTPPDRKGRKSDHPCSKCGQHEVYVTQDDGDYADFFIRCYGCGHHYRVDGPDA